MSGLVSRLPTLLTLPMGGNLAVGFANGWQIEWPGFRLAFFAVFGVLAVGMSGCASLDGAGEAEVEAVPLEASRDLTRFDAPEKFAGAEDAGPGVEVADSLLTLFREPALEAAVARTLEGNPDLLATAWRLEEAGWRTRQAGAAGRPMSNLSGSAGRSNQGREQNVFSLGLDIAWELDVWGKLAANRAAATSDERAAVADLRAARESVAAQVMQQWFSMVASQRLIELTERRLASLEETALLIDDRFEFGEGTLRDLDFAETDVALAKADLEARREELSQTARGLEVLAGAYPKGVVPAGLRLPSLSESVPSGLPSSLVGRRPDVRAAWNRIRAADARVRVAETDRYPAFSLTGNWGRQSDDLIEWLTSGFNVWSLAGSVLTPLMDGGRRDAEVEVSETRVEQSIANYEGTLLRAYREVEDALSNESRLVKQEARVQEALTAARAAESTTREDYEEGLVEILSLLEVQRRVFTTEERLIQLQNERLQNRVRLGLALGLGV